MTIATLSTVNPEIVRFDVVKLVTPIVPIVAVPETDKVVDERVPALHVPVILPEAPVIAPVAAKEPVETDVKVGVELVAIVIVPTPLVIEILVPAVNVVTL